MSVILLEGFDKYGGVNSNAPVVQALLQAEWTTASAGGLSIVTGLSSTGYALQSTGSSIGLTRTLASNYTRLIGGIRFNINTLVVSQALMQFRDGISAQCTITAELTGIINLRNGTNGGTILASSGSAVTAGSTHYLEWDITFGNTASYQVWMDGLSILSGTGDTTTTVNNYVNGLAFFSNISGTITWDDLYLFDTTGSTNNAVLLTSPRIETTFPASDSAVQFAFGAGILGSSVARVSTTLTNGGVNSLILRRFTPAVACTLASISTVPAATNGAALLRPVVYTDSSGAAGTLMSSGSTVTGMTTGVAVTLLLTTPQSLSAGTQYWLGFMTDVSANWQQSDGATVGYRATATFASGAPGTAPAMTSGQSSHLLWGNLTGITGNNWYEAAQQPPPGAQSYVFDATVNHEDLYAFNALSTTPASIYAVAVKGYIAKSDSGAKTISLRTKSSATDSGGTLTGQAPATTYGWLASYFETNPNGSVAWTGATLNAATSGVKVDS